MRSRSGGVGWGVEGVRRGRRAPTVNWDFLVSIAFYLDDWEGEKRGTLTRSSR